MNPLRLLAIAMLLAITCQAQVPPNAAPPLPPPQRGMQPNAFPPPAMQQPMAAKELVNYVIRVEWKDAMKGTNALQIVTTEGSFQLDTVSSMVKINNTDVPATVKLSGAIGEISPEKGRLQLFLGRTVPYVTSTYNGSGGGSGSSYSQLSVGMNSNFLVTFGKPLVIQSDENGEVILLVKRASD